MFHILFTKYYLQWIHAITPKMTVPLMVTLKCFRTPSSFRLKSPRGISNNLEWDRGWSLSEYIRTVGLLELHHGTREQKYLQSLQFERETRIDNAQHDFKLRERRCRNGILVQRSFYI